MKKVEFIGNVGRNAERTQTANGRELMKFSIGVSLRDSSTMWVSVITNYREGIFPYIVKGKQVFVAGDFSVSVYNGSPCVDCFADVIELLGGKISTEAIQVNESVSIPNGSANEI